MNKKKYIAMLVASLILMTGIAAAALTPTSGNADNGKNVFDENCRSCHDITETTFPTLSDLSNLSADNITNTVRNGINGTAMRAYNISKINDSAMTDLVAYIKSTTPSATQTTSYSYPSATQTTSYSYPSATQTTSYMNQTLTNQTTPNQTEMPANVATTTTISEQTQVPTETPTETVTEIQTPTPTPTPKSPGFEIVVSLIGVLSIYLLIHRNKMKR